MKHMHQCGMTALGRVDGYGCGYKWEHERDERKTLANDHMCPKCGCGPWYEQIDKDRIPVRTKGGKFEERPCLARFTHVINGVEFGFAVTGYEPLLFLTHSESGYALCKLMVRKEQTIYHCGVYTLLMYIERRGEVELSQKLQGAMKI